VSAFITSPGFYAFLAAMFLPTIVGSTSLAILWLRRRTRRRIELAFKDEEVLPAGK
jgi:Na+/H+ antiporter NhaD/arsenite permease-like protein